MYKKRMGYDPFEVGLTVQHMYDHYALCNCEFHDDSNASMVFSYNGFYYCYSCGERGGIDDLIKVTGGYKSISNLKDYDLKNNDDRNWEGLERLPIATDDGYLHKRGINNKTIRNYNIKGDDEKVVFDFYSGVKVRFKSPKGNLRYMNFGQQPKLYGRIDVNVKSKYVYVVEGIFPLLRFLQNGVNCISTLTASNVYNLNGLASSHSNKLFVIAFDPDLAGYYNASKMMFLLRGYPNVNMLRLFHDFDYFDNEYIKALNNLNRDAMTDDYYWHMGNGSIFKGSKEEEFYNKHFGNFINNNRDYKKTKF